MLWISPNSTFLKTPKTNLFRICRIPSKKRNRTNLCTLIFPTREKQHWKKMKLKNQKKTSNKWDGRIECNERKSFEAEPFKPQTVTITSETLLLWTNGRTSGLRKKMSFAFQVMPMRIVFIVLIRKRCVNGSILQNKTLGRATIFQQPKWAFCRLTTKNVEIRCPFSTKSLCLCQISSNNWKTWWILCLDLQFLCLCNPMRFKKILSYK